VEVGLGLLDLGIGGTAPRPFAVQLSQELGNALQEVGVFDPPFAPEVLDDGLFLGRVGEGDLEQAALAAVAVDPVQQAPDGPGDLGGVGEQAD
jgi:hypothetical protein